MPVIRVGLTKSHSDSKDAVYTVVRDVVVDVLNTQGGLTKDHAVLVPVEIWNDAEPKIALTILIHTKRSPDYSNGQKELVQQIAERAKAELVAKEIFSTEATIKVALTLEDVVASSV